MSLCKTYGIVINTINYSETSVICNIFTREFGLIGFIIKGVRKGHGKIKNSHLMPLNLVDIVFDLKPNQQLYTPKELSCSPILYHIHSGLEKNSIVIFISEVIQKAIFKEHIDQELFEYLEKLILALDHGMEYQNIPLQFLCKLCTILGFSPKGNWSDNEDLQLDIINGIYTNKHYSNEILLSPEASRFIHELSIIDLENINLIKVSKATRAEAFQGMIDYYHIHIIHQKKLISHEVLKEILK